jgi:DNA-binding MarR family transcriptional regulator
MKQALQTINFQGSELLTIERGGALYVAMKPVCESIGLNWRGQYNRIKRHPVLSQGVVMMTTPSGGGNQETLMLSIKNIHGWLFSIDANRVKPEIKDKLIAYQKECFDVLYDYWQNKESAQARSSHSTSACHSDLHVFLEVTRGRMKISSKGNPYNMVSMATAMVLQALYNMVGEGGEVYMSANQMAKELKINNRTVCRTIDRLERWSFLEKLSEPGYRYELRLKQTVIESALDESRANLAMNKQSVGYLSVGV